MTSFSFLLHHIASHFGITITFIHYFKIFRSLDHGVVDALICSLAQSPPLYLIAWRLGTTTTFFNYLIIFGSLDLGVVDALTCCSTPSPSLHPIAPRWGINYKLFTTSKSSDPFIAKSSTHKYDAQRNRYCVILGSAAGILQLTPSLLQNLQTSSVDASACCSTLQSWLDHGHLQDTTLTESQPPLLQVAAFTRSLP